MKTAGIKKALWFSAVLACVFATPTSAQQLISNGGFETPGFLGWTHADQSGGDGTFYVYGGSASPLNGFPVPAPTGGTEAVITDAAGPGSHLIYQNFVVPTNTGGGTVTFSLYLNNGADQFYKPANLDFGATNRTGGLNLNQQARVDILTTSADPFSVAAGDVLQNLFHTNAADPLVSGYNNFSFNISPLLQAQQGQTLRLRFAEVDNVSFFNFGVDDVSIQASPAPEPPSFAAILVGGGLLGLAGVHCRRRRASCR